MNTDLRSDDELNRIIENWLFGDPMYHIIKRGLFYRPNANGYTDRPLEAWKVPLNIAKQHERLRGWEPVRLRVADPELYCTSLDAVAKAEKKWRTQPCKPKWKCHRQLKKTLSEVVPEGESITFATARQRSEALVKVIEGGKS